MRLRLSLIVRVNLDWFLGRAPSIPQTQYRNQVSWPIRQCKIWSQAACFWAEGCGPSGSNSQALHHPGGVAWPRSCSGAEHSESSLNVTSKPPLRKGVGFTVWLKGKWLYHHCLRSPRMTHRISVILSKICVWHLKEEETLCTWRCKREGRYWSQSNDKMLNWQHELWFCGNLKSDRYWLKCFGLNSLKQ